MFTLRIKIEQNTTINTTNLDTLGDVKVTFWCR